MNSPFITYGKVFKPGNVIVHDWYRQFCLEDGNPDLVAITILGDIIAWYRNGINDYLGELARKGRLKAQKIGKLLVTTPQDIEDFIGVDKNGEFSAVI